MHSKKNLSIPPQAKDIHSALFSVLKNLISMDSPSPLHSEFYKTYTKFLTVFKQYQQTVITYNTQLNVSCKSGCSYCCYHWVEDVNSFEAEIIADYIKNHYPQKVGDILTTFNQDEQLLIELNSIVEKKLEEQRLREKVAKIDPVDLLLASFYQLKRPCALLTKESKCSVYPVRPLTCRIYLSFSNPENCRPEYINSSDIPTYLLDIEEEANQLLDTLHSRYNRYNKSGLRTLLVDYLKE